MDNDKTVYSSLEFGGSIESDEGDPYANRNLIKNQTEINIHKVNKQNDSSLMKSKAYHKLVID